ncbi:hypothetical protein BFJ63_vAg17636 [Fusarium oxysporum f. sp. narcissi]|uniref:C2H2-type domain-containing protein n=1 Tax=Fusarium oxysporum f. sp. narcissi TaxID=451672 RepID=A0A4Q2V0C6_FUSOX|nr:hypothetical protein BFJ63_vAg17636 [Fusarium oxysporum f. sp. narcissi]
MLLLDAEIDSNSKQAAIPRKSTKTSPATGGVFSCPHCTQTSGDLRDYDRHLQTHTNERPFKCKWCSRGFRRSDQLKRHGGTCKSKSAASVTSDVVSVDIDQEEGHNNYLNTSTNSDCGHGKIDGRTNDTPELVRTSTIPRKTGMNSDCHISDQAVLKIAGKLESMAENWTSEERANRRRIVLFRKTQKGSTVNATCQPVSVNERPTNSICISCIWWAERRECYVTSVDTVHLLEQLIGGPYSFSGLEKGRVRANLASFESLIVSNCKPDTVAFFNIIMGFSDPKPRDLEKDIKVFPWRILGDALKSVFGKYSISPSHTVSALNVDPDQRKFTTPEGQPILPPPRTSTTPQQACRVTETGIPDVATETDLIPTHHRLPQEVEQSLTDSWHLAPEIETSIDNYLKTFCATPVQDNIPPDCTESQPAQQRMAPFANMLPHPDHSSFSQSATFPTSQRPSSFRRRPEAQVSDDPAQSDVPVDPALLSDIQLDSNSDEAKARIEPSEGVSEVFYSLSQEQPPDPEPSSLLGDNDYPDTSINSDNGHAQVDGGINDALQLVRTSIDSANARNDENCQLTSSDPSKAVLEITGDLKSMGENWSQQPEAKLRRIVVFHRTQKGSTLNTTFELSSINGQSDHRGRVSCMFWAEKGECYITSADIILLVEYLVDTKKPFTSTEKNHIRNTLDVFQPITVSKKDKNSQGFHKIIMGFSNPQPCVRKSSVRVYLWNKLGSALEAIIKRYGFGLGSTGAKPQLPRYHMPRSQILNSTSLHMGPSIHAPLSSASFTGLPSSVDQAPPAEDAHETLQQDCVPRVEAAAPSPARPNRIYSGTGERPLKYQRMDCNRISQRQTYLTHLQGTQNLPSEPGLELPVLSTSNIIREVHPEFPHPARPDPDSNPIFPQSESSLHETFIHYESDSDLAADNIVVCVSPERDCHNNNAATLSLNKQTDVVDDTYQKSEEQARGDKLSAKIDDWGHTIADGTITIYNKNTLLTNFDRGTQHDIPVRDLCPEVQNVLDRIYENLLQVDITQQEDEAEAEHIDIKRRIRATTQRNTSCSENTDAQQCRCHEETHSTIDKLQSILPESKGLDLIRISAHELKNILEMAQDILCKPINHIKVFLVSRQGLGAHRDPRHNRGTP